MEEENHTGSHGGEEVGENSPRRRKGRRWPEEEIRAVLLRDLESAAQLTWGWVGVERDWSNGVNSPDPPLKSKSAKR
jgi:hypothetical protein